MPIIWLALHIRLPIAILTQPLVAVLRTPVRMSSSHSSSTISRWAESSPHILSSDNIPQHTCTNHNRECGYLDRFIIVLLPDIPSWLGSTSRHRWYALQEMNDRRFHIKYLVRLKYSASNAKFPTIINLQYEKYVCLLFQLPIQNYYLFWGDTIRLYSSNEVATNSNTTASQCTSLAGYNCLAKASCHPEVLTIVTLTNTKTWITNYLAWMKGILQTSAQRRISTSVQSWNERRPSNYPGVYCVPH